MTKDEKIKVLGRLLLWVGIAASLMGFGGIFISMGETGFIADAFRWKPHNEPYEGMIMMVFLAMGICMILASGNPKRHLLIVLFVILHGFLHGGIMMIDSFRQPEELTHLAGDVPLLIGIGLLFSFFMPWGDLKSSLSISG